MTTTFNARRIWRFFGCLAVVSSLAWTITHPSILSRVYEDPGSLGPFLVPFVVCEILYFAGLGLMVAHLGRHAATRSGRPRRRDMRSWSTATIRQLGDRRSFRVGFAINWVGALGAALIPALAILHLLPPSTWGVLAVTVADVAATMALRIPINKVIRSQGHTSAA